MIFVLASTASYSQNSNASKNKNPEPADTRTFDKVAKQQESRADARFKNPMDQIFVLRMPLYRFAELMQLLDNSSAPHNEVKAMVQLINDSARKQ